MTDAYEIGYLSQKVHLQYLSKKAIYCQEVDVLRSTSFMDHFGELPDLRMERQTLHSLESVLFIAVCAMICGATSFVDMEDFGNAKLDWFSERLDMPTVRPAMTRSSGFSMSSPLWSSRDVSETGLQHSERLKCRSSRTSFTGFESVSPSVRLFGTWDMQGRRSGVIQPGLLTRGQVAQTG